MASYTRLYPDSWFASPADPPWYFPATIRGGWDSNPSGQPSFSALIGYKAGTNNNLVIKSETNVVPVTMGFYRWVTTGLLAQTIQGTIDMVMGVLESNALANLQTKLYIYVTVGETDVVRGVLLDFTDSTEWPTTAQGFGLSAPQTLTALAVSDGDRLVIEMGCLANNSSGTSFSGRIYAGGAFGAIDLTLGSTNVTTERGYFSFSNAIDIDEPLVEPGDPISGNEQLFVYDRTTGELKRIIIFSGLNGGTPDPSNGLQLSNGTWVFPTEEVDSQLVFFDRDFTTVLNIVDAQGTRARSLTIDAQDHIYVGFRGDVNTTPTGDTYKPRKFDSSGTLLATYDVTLGTAGPSSIDLKADQRTLVYVSRDRVIRAFDVVTNTQLPDICTLPTETGPDYNTAARAYGIRNLIDGGYLVADLIDIKRLDADGNIIKRFTEPNVEDWQSVTVGIGWSTFVSATIGAPDSSAIASPSNPNTQGASGPGTPLAIKWNIVTGEKLFELLQDVDPDTGGSQRGFTTTDGPTTGQISAPEDVGTPEEFPIRYLRRSPIISDQEARIYHQRAQVVMQGGIGTTTGQGQDPQCMMRFSDDGGHTYGSEAWRSIGEKGNYNARVLYYRLGQTRNRVYEVTVSDPAVPVTLIDLVLDLQKGSN